MYILTRDVRHNVKVRPRDIQGEAGKEMSGQGNNKKDAPAGEAEESDKDDRELYNPQAPPPLEPTLPF